MEYNQCTRSARWTTLQTYSRSMSQHKQTPPQGWAFEPTQQPTLWWNLEKIQQTCVLAVLRSPRLLCVYHSYLQGVKFVLHVLRFHSGWMEVPNPIVCVCVVLSSAQQWECLPKPRWHKRLRACMVVNDEWWNPSDKHNNGPFFPVNLYCHQLEFQTKHLLVAFSKAVLVKEKLNTLAVSGKETIIFLSATC